MSIEFTNNASGTLSVQLLGVPTPDTTLTVQAAEGNLFPPVTTASGNFFYCTVEDSAGNIEILKCTNVSGDVFTVTRAQENTTAQTFAVGSKVELRTTAATFGEFIQRTGGQMTGLLDFNGNVLQDPVVTSTGQASIRNVPLRGADNGTANQLQVPSGGVDPTIGVNTIWHSGNDTPLVKTTTVITGGEGIAAIGDLSTNRTVALDFTELANMTGTTLAADDELPVYDTSDTAHKTILYREAGVPIITDATVNPVPTSDQVNAYWICTNAATVFFDVDAGIGQPGNVIIVQQGGAGVVAFTGGTAQINSAFTNKQTQKQYSVAVLVCTAASVWTLYGDLT